MRNSSKQGSQAKLLLGSITLFFFTAFLLLALKDLQLRSFLMMALVPLILFVSTLMIPRLFPADQLMLSLVNFLCALGVLMLYRINPRVGIDQAVNYGVGVLAMVFCILLIRHLRRPAALMPVMIGGALFLMGLPLLFGKEINGARAWVSLGGVGFQPSELVKVALVLVEAWLLSRRKMMLAGLFAGICLILLMLQKDLGTALIYYAVTLVMVFAATRNYAYVGLGLLGGAAGAWFGYVQFAHVKRRVRIWLDPWSGTTAENEGYHIVKSLIAMVNGGVWGLGLGLGNAAYASELPANTTDSIYTVILNEFGLVFGICVLMIYLIIFLRGIGIAMRANTRFHTLLALGVASLIALQTFIIIGGNIKMIPLTGVTLPFISYGGSSILSCLCLMGLLQGVASINDDEVLKDIQLAQEEYA